MWPPFGSRSRIESPSIDLPQPDSPDQAERLASVDLEVDVADRVHDRAGQADLGAEVLDLEGKGHRSQLSAAPQPHVEGVAQRVADQVAGHYHEHQADADRIDQPPVAVGDVVLRAAQHVTPRGRRILEAEAEKAEVGEREDRVGDLEGDVYDHDRERVRDQVAEDQPRSARSPSLARQ